MTTALPPLRISLLSDVPNCERSSEANSALKKIKEALRFLHDFEHWKTNNTLGNYTAHVYRSLEKATSLAKGFVNEEDLSEEDEHRYTPEYLVFLFTESQNHVFALATSRAYKLIRPHCCPSFPDKYYTHYANQVTRIEKVSKSNMLSAIAESTVTLRGELPHKIDQETEKYRSLRAIFSALPHVEGSDIKIEFNERSVVIYRDLTLMQYVQLLKPISLASTASAKISESSYTKLVDPVELAVLECHTRDYVSGFYPFYGDGWQFNLELSNKWCANGYTFRLRYQAHEAFPLDGSKKNHFLTLEDVWNRSYGTPYQLVNNQLFLEYRTLTNNWYHMPLLDCVEGWVTKPDGQVYYKIDQSWYEINKEYTEKIDQQFRALLEKPQVFLSPHGHLDKHWYASVHENDYNRLYTTQNVHPLKWYDGNVKFYHNIELFDVLQIKGDDVFIYHVKDGFNTTAKVIGAQLLSSAQFIQSCRLRSNANRAALKEYCQNVGGQSAAVLENALMTKKLHFVAAFSFYNEPSNQMTNSKSWSAKLECIKLSESLAKLNNDFIFNITPITGVKTFSVTTAIGTFNITFKKKKHFVNEHPAHCDGNYFIWTENQNTYAINSSGILLLKQGTEWKKFNF